MCCYDLACLKGFPVDPTGLNNMHYKLRGKGGGVTTGAIKLVVEEMRSKGGTLYNFPLTIGQQTSKKNSIKFFINNF